MLRTARRASLFDVLLNRLCFGLSIDKHDNDANAHFSIQNLVTSMNARLSLLELLLNTNVDGNPFKVTFESLDGVHVEGVWNAGRERVDF